MIDNLFNSEGTTFFHYLDLSTIYSLQIDDESRLARLIERVFTQPLNNNYRRLVVLEFVNWVIESKTIAPFAEYIKPIGELYANTFESNTKSPEPLYSYAIVAGLSFLRRVLAFIEAFPPQFSDYV